MEDEKEMYNYDPEKERKKLEEKIALLNSVGEKASAMARELGDVRNTWEDNLYDAIMDLLGAQLKLEWAVRDLKEKGY